MEAKQGPKYFKAWFFFLGVALVGGFAAGFVIGMIAGFLVAMTGRDINDYLLGVQILGVIVGLFASFVSFRWSVRRYIIPQIVGSTGDDIAAFADRDVSTTV